MALLAAAQILALAEDAGEILAVLDSSFRSIADIGDGFLAALASQRAALAQLLAQQDHAASQAQSVLGELAPVLTHIVSHAEGFETRIGTIRTRLRTLEGIGQTVNLAAVNACIKAARATTGRQELTYIAMSVKEHAHLALRTLGETARALDQLRQSLDATEYGEMRQTMAASKATWAPWPKGWRSRAPNRPRWPDSRMGSAAKPPFWPTSPWADAPRPPASPG